MEQKDEMILFKDKSECSGCGACMNICPKDAIKMVPDSAGFLYPVIDNNICISCGQCKKVCFYRNSKDLIQSDEVYSAVSKDDNLLMKSASGGIFAEISRAVVEDGGYVYGAAFVKSNDELEVRHICASEKEELNQLQGSKYVHSVVGYSYRDVKAKLDGGAKVLFSGTPCQISGLNSYLGKDYDNLFTVDIVCHGVPSQKIFKDYIACQMKKLNGKIEKFCFRDKSKGWGLNASFVYKDKNGKLRKKTMPFRLSSYYDMFIRSEIYRENCYSCPFADKKRVGDMTIGDFWGIQRQHPELMKANGGRYDEEKGVSCVLINTKKGKQLLDLIADKIDIHSSDFEKVSAENFQLLRPSALPDTREQILNLYEHRGYSALESYFSKRLGIKKYFYLIKSMIPQKLKVKLKAIVGK